MTKPMEENENASALKRALFAVKDMRSKLEAIEYAKTEPIAVIGMGCRFPGGANDPNAYWKILNEGLDVIREVPADRWNIDEYYDSDQNAPGKMYVRKSGFIDNVDKFEPQFFGISPREAISMDPQQRLLLEVAWEALEHSGIIPAQLSGSQTGVFIGMSTNDYSGLQVKNGDLDNFDAYVGTGTSFSVAAGRIAYILGLHGPTLTLDTACSSALVAVHLACQSLRSKQANMALAGGVSLILAPEGTISMSKSHALAPDGHSKTFDASADGYARGEGCGVVVLKRLADAINDGDNIHALIKGSAINHDGRSSGLTVPNGQAQQAVIRAALEDAGGQDPHQVHFVETHGTGTQLGDPIEVRALAAVYGKGRARENALVLGSVKANIGHLEAAAGMAGLIKVVLAFQNEKIPAQVHFKDPNPIIDWDALPVKVAGEGEVWLKGKMPRLAGVNAFGFSGTNAHILLEEPANSPVDVMAVGHSRHLLALSANDENALVELASRYSNYLESQPNVWTDNVTYTINARRTHFSKRLSIVGETAEQLKARLDGFINKNESEGILTGSVVNDEPKVAFLFTGQGSQYLDMGKKLYETEAVFRAVLDKCDALLHPHLGRSLLSVIYPKAGDDSLINETAYTQPALFSIEYALAELWRSWGVIPSVVMGHSVGEYVAACVAGLFSLEDGLKLIAERGRLMQALPRDGAMAAVFGSRDLVTESISSYLNDVSIAAVNGPDNVVISGRENVVQLILENLSKQGVKASRLSVSHAFHSPLMDPILASFEKTAAAVAYLKPTINLVSNVTGTLISFEQVGQPQYWRHHVRQPVQFQKAMETLRDQGCSVFLEIGPQPTLLSMGQRCISGGNLSWVGSLRQRKDDWQQMLESLGALYVRGLDIDWEGFYQEYSHKSIPLPTYPFQRQRYWFKLRDRTSHLERQVLHPLLSRKIRSPRIKGAAFEAELGVHFPRFLNDHRIFETAVFPGAGYMEMGLAVGQHMFAGKGCSIADMVIREVLLLPDQGEKIVQIVISPVESGRATFEIFSLDEDVDESEARWVSHATGVLLLEAVIEIYEPFDIGQLKAGFTNQVNTTTFYQELAELGIEYGFAFQGLSQIWQGNNEALGFIELRPEDAAISRKFQIHPALLDASFQLFGAATPASMREDIDKIYVPVGMQQLKVYLAGQARVWAHVSFSAPITTDDGILKDSLTGSIKLYGEDGRLVAEVHGLQIRQISRASVLPGQKTKIEDWLYEFNWQQSDRPLAENKSISNWLIFADTNGVGDALAYQLKDRGMSVMLVKPGDEYQQVDGSSYRLSPTRAEHFQQLLADIKVSFGGSRPGVIQLWNMDNLFDVGEQKTEAVLRDAEKNAGESILHLVQAFAHASLSPSGLWLVTQGVHARQAGEGSSSLVQAGIWGLMRTIMAEYPNWNCRCVDIASDNQDELLGEILANDDENQVVLRNGERYVARLDRPQSNVNKLTLPDHPFELTIPSPGALDGLTLSAVDRLAPKAKEVEIRVKATGLNFRDVLNALGMYPGAKIPLGIECAGVVEAIGEGVTEFKIGDEVIGLTIAAFRSFATIPVDRIFPKPKNVTLAQAVSIPTVFLTAAYGLHHLARLKAGDRVLIHAAAGGVGLAAVQLAQRAGAEVFATAGSPEKHAYLRSLGVQHVFDSRNLSFAAAIMKATNGKGVHIVLNSLADEFIPQSINLLADGGCFLEIGKRDDWDQAKVAQVNPTLKYYRYDLGTEMVNDMPFVSGMLKEILSDFEKDVFKPLPVLDFAMDSVRDAFRFMAQAKHIGKIVVVQNENSFIRAGGAYLITGGLGGLGLLTARWLVDHGAQSIVLMSRSEPTSDILKTLDELKVGGANIVVLQGDVSLRDDIERVLKSIEQNMPPLCGIFHEAGVLDDGVLSQQNWSRFERVMNPKIYGAWNLHELTMNMNLDLFVMFSSAAAIIGSVGQGNYAMANSFLDGLAHYRRFMGLPAISINWGAWAEIGMAAELDGRNPHRRTSRRIEAIKPEDGMKVLELLLQERPVQRLVLPMTLNKFSQPQTGQFIQPLLRKIIQVTEQFDRSTSGVVSIEQMKTLSSKERENVFQEYVKKQVIKTLGLDSSQNFNSLRVLTDLGLDSLMAVELKNKIESDFGINIPVTFFLDQATASELSKRLCAQFDNDLAVVKTDKLENVVNSDDAKRLLENFDSLSESDVDSLLNDLLTKNKDGA